MWPVKPKIAPFFRNSSQAQKDEETIYREIDGFEEKWPELSKTYDLFPRYPGSEGRERYFTDEAFNLESWDESTAFHQLMALCEAGEVHAIYVSEGGRLFRSRSNALRGRILDILRENQICVITKMGEISQSALTMEIISAVGAEDKRAFLRKCHDAKITRLKDEGRPPTGRPPFCFSWSKKDKQWSLIEDEVKLFKTAVGLSIGRVFDEMTPQTQSLVHLHPEGLSDSEIAKKLSDFGYSKHSFYERINLSKMFSNRASKDLNSNAVDKMFKKDRYRGFLEVAMYDSSSIGSKNKRPSDKKVFKIPVPRIISDDDWQALQAKRRGRRKWATRNIKHDYLCKDILICDECGVPLAARPKYVTRYVRYRGEVITYEPTLYYTCARKKKVNGFRCSSNKCHNVGVIDGIVWQSFLNTLQNKKTLQALLATTETSDSRAQRRKEYESMILQQKSVLRQMDKHRERANRLLVHGAIEEVDFNQQIQEIKSRKEQIETEIYKLEGEIRALAKNPLVESVIDTLLAVDFSTATDFDQRRNLLHSLASKVSIKSNGEIEILLRSGIEWSV
jgi:hypothetical protein